MLILQLTFSGQRKSKLFLVKLQQKKFNYFRRTDRGLNKWYRIRLTKQELRNWHAIRQQSHQIFLKDRKVWINHLLHSICPCLKNLVHLLALINLLLLMHMLILICGKKLVTVLIWCEQKDFKMVAPRDLTVSQLIKIPVCMASKWWGKLHKVRWAKKEIKSNLAQSLQAWCDLLFRKQWKKTTLPNVTLELKDHTASTQCQRQLLITLVWKKVAILKFSAKKIPPCNNCTRL